MKILFSSIIFFGYLIAGSTGKIGGIVLDEKTGLPLPGVNVIIGETMLGAASSTEGSFMIINIPPGEYSVSASMIGYKKYTIIDVNVSVDRTTRLEFYLRETIIEGEEITVVAKRKVVELDRTNSASYINRSEIELLPVTSLEDIIQLQAGVVSDASGNLHIRGGRSREISYMIDGIPVTDNYSQSGGSMVEIENNFIEELQVITGTFNAEYGSAQSGVVNVVTKMPEAKYEGSIEQLIGGFYSSNKPQYIALDTFQPMSEKEMKISVSGPLLNIKKISKINKKRYKKN